VRKKIIIGAVGIGLVGALGIGATAYASIDKAVTLSVDGKDRTIHTFGDNVSDVLAGENVKLASRDLVAPSPATSVSDGTRIVVRYARPLALTVDGEKRTHWVTALNVNQAFSELRVRYDGAKLSASRSAGISREGMALDVRTLKRVTVKHDRRTTPLQTTAVTVGEALNDANVKVDADDRLRPGLAARVYDGSEIALTRVDVKSVKRNVPVAYKKVRKADSSMYEETTKTERAGKAGLKAQVVQVIYLDGRRSKVTVTSEKWVSKPVDQIIRYGTKERPAESEGSGSGGNVGGSVDSLNWAALADCESSGNPDAVNPAGYYGLYQFAPSTWRSVGGSGLPTDYGAGEQTYRAKLLYQREGSSPWPVCGSRLYN
jgi:resuscitation-promoting factor RpfB